MTRRWIAAILVIAAAGCASSSAAPGEAESPKHRFHAPRLTNGEQPRKLRAQDEGEIRAAISKHSAELTDCYEQRRRIIPTLAGTVETRFLILSDGRVRDAQAAGLDPDVDACVARVLSGIRFERREGIWEGTTEVNTPFTFQPPAKAPDAAKPAPTAP